MIAVRYIMVFDVIFNIALPFFGTSLGAGCVFFMKKQIGAKTQRALIGLAAGVMLAASVWSLLIPAMEQVSDMGSFSFAPAAAGVAVGVVILLILDKIAAKLSSDSGYEEMQKRRKKSSSRLFLAVTLHNLPEGMAVGVIIAGFLEGGSDITAAMVTALSLGIAIQNFPEGAIISMPLNAAGVEKKKAFLYGVLSGAVEPVGAVITVLIAGVLTPVLPFLLSLAAGAMLYVIVEEMIPGLAEGEHSYFGTIFFTAGFILMMALDVALD